MLIQKNVEKTFRLRKNGKITYHLNNNKKIDFGNGRGWHSREDKLPRRLRTSKKKETGSLWQISASG